MNKIRVWWIPLIRMTQFYRDVPSVEEGARLLDTLQAYDAFQYENNIKPEYCNAGGLQMFDPDDHHDGLDGSWCDWYSKEAATDDPSEYLEYMAMKNGG